MKQFIVSARKYRPQAFDEVVGQEHVTQTLNNAIKNDKLGQAFLFCGPRGVGKTTCARILARVINNMNATEEGVESFNVYELDAASHNSVDDIRGLVDQVRILPQKGKYKVYIIDEVHMLSNTAFNAFLKTLEEPPPHAIFILATTEKHKILPTILSRCQIFDFNRITVNDIAQYLAKICTQENIEHEPGALHIIAQKADGALRDALSIFDRIVSFSEGKLALQTVLESLNVLDYDYYFKFMDAFVSQDAAETLILFDNAQQKGFEGNMVLDGLGQHIRDLLVSKEATTLKLLDVPENIIERYKEQAAYIPEGFLITALAVINDGLLSYKSVLNKRLHTEIHLLKLAGISGYVKGEPLDTQVKKNTSPKPDLEKNTEANQTESQPARASTIQNQVTSQNKVEEVQETKDVEPLTPRSEPMQENPPIPPTEKPVPSTMQDEHSINELESEKKKPVTGVKIGGLDSFLAEEEEKKGILPEEEVKIEPDSITTEELQTGWEKVIEHYMKNKNMLLNSSVKNYLPEVEGNHTVLQEVSNMIESNLISQERETILNILHTTLNKQGLEFKIQINEAKAEQINIEKPATAEQKFQNLSQDYPALNDLKERFKLEVDD